MKSQNIIAEYRKKLKASIFFQNIALVTGGNSAAKLIGIISAPVITRLYTPADYGVFSVFISIMGVAGSVATLRYEVTIPLAREEKLAENLLRLCFIITGLLSLIWVAGILIIGDRITEILSIEQLKPYLWLMPIMFFGAGVYTALKNWTIRHKSFRLIIRTRIGQAVSSAGLKIGLGLLGVTPLGLFLGHIAQEAAGIVSFFSRLMHKNPAFFKYFSWQEIKVSAKRYKRFPMVQSWSQLLLALGANLPVLFIGLFYGVEVAGIYGLAHGMVSLPMSLVGESVAQVYYSEISGYGKGNPGKILRLTISLIKKLFWIGIIPVGIIIAFGPWLFSVVFSPEWHDAGLYAQFLAILILTRFISSPIASIFNVYEKQSLQLSLNIIRVVLIFASFYASNYFSLSALNAIVVYSVLMVAYYGGLTLIVLRVVKSCVE